MQVILYCDRLVDCIPVRDCPEALLPFCNMPLLEYLLKYIQNKGFQKAILLAPDEQTRQLAESLHLKLYLQYADSIASLRADMPTLLLRRLCVPDWDMGELCSLGGQHAVKLIHKDGSPADAELHPQSSVLLEPKKTAVLQNSNFQHVHTPAEYRKLQQELLKTIRSFRKMQIGEGVNLSRSAYVDDFTIIGNDCMIAEHAKLEGCCLGSGVQIGANVSLKDCVICSRAFIDNGTKLENAVIPENTVLYPDNGTASAKKYFVLPDDGICNVLPKWNTAETALKAGSALTVLGKRILIGYSHPNAESLAFSAISGAVTHGASVWYAGECALSQLIYLGELTSCSLLLWIQGEKTMQIRPFNAGGFPLTESQANRLSQAIDAETCCQILQIGTLHHVESLLDLWQDSCRNLLPSPEFEIHLSCSNPTLRKIAQDFFSGGTGQRITLSLSEDGTEISAFSADSGMIRYEQLLLLSLLSVQKLALPDNFHLSAETFASQYQCQIYRVLNFTSAHAELYRKQGICTDGIKLFAHVLQVLSQRQLTPAQAVALLPELCTVQHEITTSLTRQTIEQLRRADPDSRITLTMPLHSKLIKLKAHADSVETAAELCGIWEKKLRILESELS